MNVINEEQKNSSLDETRTSTSSADSDTVLVSKKKTHKKGTSSLETLMHIIKANIGTGVLAMYVRIFRYVAVSYLMKINRENDTA